MSELERLSSRELIENAAKRGTLSPQSSAYLQSPAIAQSVQLALEGSFSVKRPGLILLVTMMPDDSSSMNGGKGSKKDSVIIGHNELLDAMRNSVEGKRTMLQTRYLNGNVLNPFSPLAQCRYMNEANYPCVHGTPLYEQTLITLGAVMAKTEELVSRGVLVRSATLIMTDGESTDTRTAELLSQVVSVIRDVSRIGDHLVAGMGFSGGTSEEFRDIFVSMGINPQFIFNATSRDEILDKFRVFKRAAVAALMAGPSDPRSAFEG